MEVTGAREVPEIIRDWIRIAEQELASESGVANKRALAERIVNGIFDQYCGQQVYLPATFQRRAKLAREVYTAWNGNNLAHLVRTFKRSNAAIYRLIQLGRQLEHADRQGDLFESQ